MDPLRVREIASLGGRMAHVKGTAHEFTREEARLAGQAGGKKVSSRGRDYMAELGRKGGQAQQRMHQARKAAEALRVAEMAAGTPTKDV